MRSSRLRTVEPRLHADRAAGGDRDHRRAHRPAAARRAGRPRGRPTGPVRQQPEADRPRDSQLRRHRRDIPPRRDHHEWRPLECGRQLPELAGDSSCPRSRRTPPTTRSTSASTRTAAGEPPRRCLHRLQRSRSRRSSARPTATNGNGKLPNGQLGAGNPRGQYCNQVTDPTTGQPTTVTPVSNYAGQLRRQLLRRGAVQQPALGDPLEWAARRLAGRGSASTATGGRISGRRMASLRAAGTMRGFFDYRLTQAPPTIASVTDGTSNSDHRRRGDAEPRGRQQFLVPERRLGRHDGPARLERQHR